MVFLFSTGALGLFSAYNPVAAQASSADLIEQAGAKARELEELKTALNGPDQNMRLAVFDIMVNSGDDSMRQVAIDTGLGSADSTMQSRALKEVILSLSHIVLSLEIDKSRSSEVQAKAQGVFDVLGSQYQFPISEVDRETGAFKIDVPNSYGDRGAGQINGTTEMFVWGKEKGALSLIDEATIQGLVTLRYPNTSAYHSFIATAKNR